jgi:starvation-inducible DNA-binding protein
LFRFAQSLLLLLQLRTRKFKTHFTGVCINEDSALGKGLSRGRKERKMATAEKVESKNEKASSAKNVGQLDHNAVEAISNELRQLLADSFALYLKTKNFHWHISGPHFRDYHLLLDEHGDQILAITDDIAERVRKVGGTTIRSIGHIARLKRIADNDAEYVTPTDMLSELYEDNKALVLRMRAAHELCGNAVDVATTSLLESWIDEAQRRIWFLFEVSRA